MKTHRSQRSGKSFNTTAPAATGTSAYARLEAWSMQHQRWIIAALLIVLTATRTVHFHQAVNSPLATLHEWSESDNAFFDHWARTIAGGDLLIDRPLHPYHHWHESFATAYFNAHPGLEQQVLEAHPERAPDRSAGELLWEDWYGGKQFHQEPLYPYVLALLHTVLGNGVFAMYALQSVLGIVSGLLLYLITRRHFGAIPALVAGILYAFNGALMFHELVLLRTSWAVCFSLVLVWLGERVLRTGRAMDYAAFGYISGLACLLQSFFVIYLGGILVLAFWSMRERTGAFIRLAGITVSVFVLALAPAIARNIMVGAPPFSLSSVGTITFITSNHVAYNVPAGFHVAPREVEVMAEAQGRFLSAIPGTLGTHDGLGSYLQQLWMKWRGMWSGVEWASNDNYAYAREWASILELAWIDFHWIGPLGLAGLVLAWRRRRELAPLYGAVALHMLMMLAFYVTGRFRAPMAAALVPFAAFAMVQPWKNGLPRTRTAWTALAVIALATLFSAYAGEGRKHDSQLRMTEYVLLYDQYYKERIAERCEQQGDFKGCVALVEEYIQYTPDHLRTLRRKPRSCPANYQALAGHFANLHTAAADLHQLLNDAERSRTHRERATLLRSLQGLPTK